MRVALTIALALACAACSVSPWQRYPHSLYQTLREGTPESLRAHQSMLQSVVADAKATRKRPPAGIQAELAYYSWLTGQHALVEGSLESEVRDYPESQKFVAILSRFLPTLPVVIDPPKQAEKAGTLHGR